MTTIPTTPRPDIPAAAGRPAAARAAGSRSANVGLWVLQGLLATAYVLAALPKLGGDPQTVAGFADIGFGRTAMYVIGALEIAGAVALLIPRLCGLAGLAFVGLMVGAVIATVLGIGVAAAIVPGTLLVLAAAVAWGRRDRTAALVALVVRRLR